MQNVADGLADCQQRLGAALDDVVGLAGDVGQQLAELAAEVVDGFQHRDQCILGEVEGRIQYIEQALADILQRAHDFLHQLIAGFERRVQQVEDGFARGLDQRLDQIRHVVGDPVDDIGDGLAESFHRVDHGVDNGVDGADDGIGDILEEIHHRRIGVGRRRRLAFLQARDLGAGVAQVEQHVAQRVLVDALVLLQHQVAHQRAPLCARQLADGVHHAARLAGMAVAGNQRAPLFAAHAGRLLE